MGCSQRVAQISVLPGSRFSVAQKFTRQEDATCCLGKPKGHAQVTYPVVAVMRHTQVVLAVSFCVTEIENKSLMEKVTLSS